MRRTATKVLAAILLLVLGLTAAMYLYLRRSLPLVDGTVTVSGVTAPLEIVRDTSGIPHVRASNRRDALFGLGYVHAQDRLWQMEFQRRIAHGRLSEIFGAATLAQDRFLRTLGTGRAAEAAWDRLPGEARDDILAYVAGVNAFLEANRGSRLPPEFTLLRFAPEPWTGPDVVGWVKMMAWDLSMNYSSELLRHDLVARVGTERANALMQQDSLDSLTIIPGTAIDASVEHSPGRSEGARNASSSPASRGEDWSRLFAHTFSSGHPAVRDLLLGGSVIESLGSNSWVVSGSRTASGFPLLANDPHLGTRIPSVWYLARLSGGEEFDVMGATLPGAPGVATGRNRSIAWGVTNVGADVQDFFIERLDPTGTQVEFQGTFEPLRTIDEVIEIRGEDPVHLTVRFTRHGPLISDAINAVAEASGTGPERTPLPPMALRWTALDDDDTTVVAFLRVNRARNWSEFTEALRHFVVPSQNFVYADVEGHIGYYAPGRIPVRAAGDGRSPAEGWSGEMEWTGWVPFDDLPHVFDPPGGAIVTANNRPAIAALSPAIGSDFPEPYRARRITDLLADRRGLTADDFSEIQSDTRSLHAEELLPLLLSAVRTDTPSELQALERLDGWNHDMSGANDAAALFQAWFLELAPALASDDLTSGTMRTYAGRFSYVTRFASSVLRTDDGRWCDDKDTQEPETCQETVTGAFRRALTLVTDRMGTDATGWRWERMHRAVFPHQGLDSVPLLRRLLSRTVPGTGDWSTVNVGPAAADGSFEQRSIPSYRQIVDLSPADDSRFIDAVGQSGHFLSPHYDDFLPDWRSVGYRSMKIGKERERGGTLRLLPR
ncbi:MAG: penicillin acylase family protein [Vicinamibacterales bacterium]